MFHRTAQSPELTNGPLHFWPGAPSCTALVGLASIQPLPLCNYGLLGPLPTTGDLSVPTGADFRSVVGNAWLTRPVHNGKV